MPVAPHSEAEFSTSANVAPAFKAPQPGQRHQNLYPGVKVPRTANFNPDSLSGASWIARLPELNETQIAYNDDYYRKRLQSLAAVDDLIISVFDTLEHLNLMDNTYIIYTTDNGCHIGQHRLDLGKTCAFEEDVNILFFIRGPGILKKAKSNVPTSHTDLAPTIFRPADIDLRDDFDGLPMPLFRDHAAQDGHFKRSEHVSIEFWGVSLSEGEMSATRPYQNNTYKSLRRISSDKGYDLSYTAWYTNEH